MANSVLYGKEYKVPGDVLKHINSKLINHPNHEGIKRAKHILKNGTVTYQTLKRLKNFFDSGDWNDKIQYELAGGDLMKNFVDSTLNTDRDSVNRSNNVKRNVKFNMKSDLKTFKSRPELNEDNKNKLKKNAIAVIVNSDNKILLLKRAGSEEDWMPNKWALVGGGVEKGETPEKACSREIKEETGLEINKFIKSFQIQRNSDSVEYVFTCRFDDKSNDIQLNDEHTNYGWFDVNEIKTLDIVPNLIEYLKLVFKKYE